MVFMKSLLKLQCEVLGWVQFVLDVAAGTMAHIVQARDAFCGSIIQVVGAIVRHYSGEKNENKDNIYGLKKFRYLVVVVLAVLVNLSSMPPSELSPS